MSGKLVTFLDRLARSRLLVAVSIVVTGLAVFIDSDVWRICYCVVAVIVLFAAWVRFFAATMRA
jgi:hypothetical protein